jgi:hypothetical protein
MNNPIYKIQVKNGVWYIPGTEDLSQSDLGQITMISQTTVVTQAKTKHTSRSEVEDLHFVVTGSKARAYFHYKKVIGVYYLREQDNSNKNS